MGITSTDRARIFQRGTHLIVALAMLLVLELMGTAPLRASARPPYSISPDTVILDSGDEQLFTIALPNTTSSATTGNVVVIMPDGITYVDGSASNNGVSTQRGGVNWSSVDLPANTTTNLTFKVTPSGTVDSQETVTMMTAISSSLGISTIPALITLAPGTSNPSNFSDSTMTVTPDTISTDEVASYTLTLKNSGSTATTDVSVNLDWRLEYVDGTADPSASYNATTNILKWDDVSVPGGGEVTLTFDATLIWHVGSPSIATTTATIASSGMNVLISSVVVLSPVSTPAPTPVDPLAGSVKLVSQRRMESTDTVTYTIILNNSSASEVTATVTDEVPEELLYETDSASPTASYDSATATLTWSDVAVPAGDSLELTFRVGMATPVTSEILVVNKAKIVTSSHTYERSASPLRLLPDSLTPPPSTDTERPKVTSVEIADGDIHTDRDVTINIAATDNVGVTQMQVREWVLDKKFGFPRWREVQSSGIISYTSSLSWTLSENSGTHFVGVCVKDAAGNASVLSRKAMDFASLLLSDTSIAVGEARPYLIHLEQGQSVTANLTTASGDADLYAWYPSNFGLRNHRSVAVGTAADSVTFTAPRTGTYIILVFGYESSTYSLSITVDTGTTSANTASVLLDSKDPGLLTEPAVSVAGMDPLSVASGDNGAPSVDTNIVYLPIITQ
ncbi:MAG: DUF4139 domain-containing protein [Oscillochloris sp.]|nr:DUF4139 domain-containing protein [Oscillochloris sp.]